LTRYFSSAATASATTTEATITTATSSTTHGTINIDLLVLFLGINVSLCNKKVQIQIMKSLRICFGSESFNERVKFKIKIGEDITYGILIIETLAGRHHLIGIALHLG
jgi:hypothetical protein